MQISYLIEFDSDEASDRVNAALETLGRSPPFPRLHLHDRKARFSLLRALLDNQRQMRQSGVPTVVLVVSAFIHFVMTPMIISIVWLFSLPQRLSRTTPEPTPSDLSRYSASSERPIALTALPFVVQQLSTLITWRNVVISTSASETESSEQRPPRRERLTTSDLSNAGEERLTQLVGSKIELRSD